jgi:hypothetical protein
MEFVVNEAECEGANWIELAQERVQWQAVVNTVINPSGFIKGA